MKDTIEKSSNFLCIGHRGTKGLAPENTLLSVRKALELGVSCVEIDVYLVEGHLIVFHDDMLERTTDGKGNVMEQSFEGLRGLDAGEGQQIPTLEEIFGLVNKRVGINIELKGPATAQPVVDFIARYKKAGWTYDMLLVSSFNHRELKKVKALDPHLKLGFLISDIPADKALSFADMGAFSVHPSIKVVTADFVKDAHARGLRVYVFTVNGKRDIIKAVEMGVDGVFTDYPDRVFKQIGAGDLNKRFL